MTISDITLSITDKQRHDSYNPEGLIKMPVP